jgi:hypothetical protein
MFPRTCWSLTLYSENTRRPYDNGGNEIRSVSRDAICRISNSTPDGSIDLYVGAKAPPGFEQNLMKTLGTDGWFVYFRLYAPLQPFFDKTFPLPDFVRIDYRSEPLAMPESCAIRALKNIKGTTRTTFCCGASKSCRYHQTREQIYFGNHFTLLTMKNGEKGIVTP